MSLSISVTPPAFEHVDLPPARRWGCSVFGRGRGVVIGHTRFGGFTATWHVALEDGTVCAAWPAMVRPALALVPV